jgi:hypothetical protein
VLPFVVEVATVGDAAVLPVAELVVPEATIRITFLSVGVRTSTTSDIVNTIYKRRT